MEVLTYISCMDTAYVRENPPPKSPYKVQYLHFRYLKFLVIELVPKGSICLDGLPPSSDDVEGPISKPTGRCNNPLQAL